MSCAGYTDVVESNTATGCKDKGVGIARDATRPSIGCSKLSPILRASTRLVGHRIEGSKRYNNTIGNTDANGCDMRSVMREAPEGHHQEKLGWMIRTGRRLSRRPDKRLYRVERAAPPRQSPLDALRRSASHSDALQASHAELAGHGARMLQTSQGLSPLWAVVPLREASGASRRGRLVDATVAIIARLAAHADCSRALGRPPHRGVVACVLWGANDHSDCTPCCTL